MVVIKVKKIDDGATLPTKKHENDAGWDLYSNEELVILPKTQATVGTGVQLAGLEYFEPVRELGSPTPIGYLPSLKDFGLALLFWPRSGLDSKHGIHTGAGVIDEGYRGELLVLIKNMGAESFKIKKGDKIAQMIPTPIPHSVIEEVSEIDEGDRGEVGGILETKG
jgi:dUTP pyrophosphatase